MTSIHKVKIRFLRLETIPLLDVIQPTRFDFSNSIFFFSGYACAWDMLSPVITYKDTNITVEPENEESFRSVNSSTIELDS